MMAGDGWELATPKLKQVVVPWRCLRVDRMKLKIYLRVCWFVINFLLFLYYISYLPIGDQNGDSDYWIRTWRLDIDDLDID